MSIRRVWIHAVGLCVVAALGLAGCATAPAPIANESHMDDWGGPIADDAEITAESVQRTEMMHQRAQFELRVGPSFTFDLFDPSAETHTEDSYVAGFKFQLEAVKNLYLGLSFDWAQHDVDPASVPALADPIQRISFYDRLTVLGNMDYDIPLSDDRHPWIIRLGFGGGVAIILPESVNSAQKVADVYQIVFRPSIGVRWPFHDNWLLFAEAYYDIIPERSLETTESQTISGERPVFSNGAIIFGIALQW